MSFKALQYYMYFHGCMALELYNSTSIENAVQYFQGYMEAVEAVEAQKLYTSHGTHLKIERHYFCEQQRQTSLMVNNSSVVRKKREGC